jgi:hypothetical protein
MLATPPLSTAICFILLFSGSFALDVYPDLVGATSV